MDILNRLRSLKQDSSSLEPDHSHRNKLNSGVLNYADEFLNSNPDLPAYSDLPSELELDIPADPGNIEGILGKLAKDVDGVGLNPASPNYLGYIPGGGSIPQPWVII